MPAYKWGRYVSGWVYVEKSFRRESAAVVPLGQQMGSPAEWKEINSEKLVTHKTGRRADIFNMMLKCILALGVKYWTYKIGPRNIRKAWKWRFCHLMTWYLNYIKRRPQISFCSTITPCYRVGNSLTLISSLQGAPGDWRQPLQDQMGAFWRSRGKEAGQVSGYSLAVEKYNSKNSR